MQTYTADFLLDKFYNLNERIRLKEEITMNLLLTDAKQLLKEEIKGKSSYHNFMSLINPMSKCINRKLRTIFNHQSKLAPNDLYLFSLKSRLNDIKFDVRSLKKEVFYNNGIIDFSNVDTYDDYAIEDIFKNTHILVETLENINQ